MALEALLESRLVVPSTVCSLLRGRRVCVAGSSEELLNRRWHVPRGCVVVAADGATALLLEAGVVPDVVVTDLDGPWGALEEAARRGSLLVLYAHGDNVASVRRFTGLLERFAAQAQCMLPGSQALLLPPTGFTDGDRAVGLVVLCGAEELSLIGMEFGGRVAAGTKAWLRSSIEPWPEKRRKLAIAARITSIWLGVHKLRRGTGIGPQSGHRDRG